MPNGEPLEQKKKRRADLLQQLHSSDPFVSANLTENIRMLSDEISEASKITNDKIIAAFLEALSSPMIGVLHPENILNDNPLIGDMSGGNSYFCNNLYAALQAVNEERGWRFRPGSARNFLCANDKHIAEVFNWYKESIQ